MGAELITKLIKGGKLHDQFISINCSSRLSVHTLSPEHLSASIILTAPPWAWLQSPLVCHCLLASSSCAINTHAHSYTRRQTGYNYPHVCIDWWPTPCIPPGDKPADVFSAKMQHSAVKWHNRGYQVFIVWSSSYLVYYISITIKIIWSGRSGKPLFRCYCMS